MRGAPEEAGFSVEQTTIEHVSYLHSPHGMPRRGEEIFVCLAVRGKVRAAETEFNFSPEWMADACVGIPALPEFEQTRAERTIDVEILKCIDGRASIEDIVVILSSRYKLEPDRCRNAINRFFTRRIEGG